MDNVVPGTARDQKIEVTVVGIAATVTVVDQHLYATLRRAVSIGRERCLARQPQQSVPGSDVIPGADHFWQAQFEMVEIDVGTATVAGQEGTSPVLRIIGGQLAQRMSVK